MSLGNCNEIWDSGGDRGRGAALFDNPDRRRTAKASNDVGEVEEGGETVFAPAGMGAE